MVDMCVSRDRRGRVRDDSAVMAPVRRPGSPRAPSGPRAAVARRAKRAVAPRRAPRSVRPPPRANNPGRALGMGYCLINMHYVGLLNRMYNIQYMSASRVLHHVALEGGGLLSHRYALSRAMDSSVELTFDYLVYLAKTHWMKEGSLHHPYTLRCATVSKRPCIFRYCRTSMHSRRDDL